MQLCKSCGNAEIIKIGLRCSKCGQEAVGLNYTDIYWSRLSEKEKIKLSAKALGVDVCGDIDCDTLEEYIKLVHKKATETKIKNEKSNPLSEKIKKDVAIEQLRSTGAEGYYEYCVRTIRDSHSSTNVAILTDELNQLGLEGWKLVSSHTNEVAVHSVADFGVGTHNTVDETVLIFERFVKI